MTLPQLYGCALIAFGPAISMFALTIARNPIRVILILVSAFFWLLSLLFSSILYQAVPPLKNTVAFGAISFVLMQEIFRFLWYIVLSKIEGFLRKFTLTSVELTDSKLALSYVSGLGFGIMSGIFSLVNVLADMTGPGTIGIHGDPPSFFITSAVTALAFIFMQISWSIIFFNGLYKKIYWHIAFVVLSHLFASSITLLNPLYAVTIPLVYITMFICCVMSFWIAGGSYEGLKSSFKRESPAVIDVPAEGQLNDGHAT